MNEQPLGFDVVVCGGGPSGIAAAIAAASAGAKTLLVERMGRLGGTSTNGVVHQIPVWTDTTYVRDLHALAKAHGTDSEFLDIAYADTVTASGAEILLHAPVSGVLKAPGAPPTLAGVRLATPSGPLDISAKRIVDATGDGTVAFLAGAKYDVGRASDGLTQPATIMFRVSGVNHAETMEANGGRAKYRFPEGSWDHVTMNARDRGELPPTVGKVRTYLGHRETDRYINATQVNYIDGASVFDLTKAEIEGRKQVPAIMDFLRKRAPGFGDAYVSLMPAMVGIRETRRFRGIAALTRDDCLAGRQWPDAVVVGCRAPLDVHNPTGPGQAEGVSEAHPAGKDPAPKPYDIPYGCLVPEEFDGLLLAGRCISGDHDAHASYRWQTVCMATGAAAGFAAAESLRQGVQPRNLDIRPVQARLGIRR